MFIGECFIFMYKSIHSVQNSGEKDTIINKQHEISNKIKNLLIPHDKKYGVFYDIRNYVSYQQDLADLIPEIRKYCTYDDMDMDAGWLFDLKNVIYKNTKIEHYKFVYQKEILYLCIHNVKCRIYISFQATATS